MRRHEEVGWVSRRVADLEAKKKIFPIQAEASRSQSVRTPRAEIRLSVPAGLQLHDPNELSRSNPTIAGASSVEACSINVNDVKASRSASVPEYRLARKHLEVRAVQDLSDHDNHETNIAPHARRGISSTATRDLSVERSLAQKINVMVMRIAELEATLAASERRVVLLSSNAAAVAAVNRRSQDAEHVVSAVQSDRGERLLQLEDALLEGKERIAWVEEEVKVVSTPEAQRARDLPETIGEQHRQQQQQPPQGTRQSRACAAPDNRAAAKHLRKTCRGSAVLNRAKLAAQVLKKEINEKRKKSFSGRRWMVHKAMHSRDCDNIKGSHGKVSTQLDRRTKHGDQHGIEVDKAEHPFKAQDGDDARGRDSILREERRARPHEGSRTTGISIGRAPKSTTFAPEYPTL